MPSAGRACSRGITPPTAQTFTLPHPQRLVQDLSCLSWTCLAFLLAFMSLRLTTLSLPSMLAFAALHCLARASSLPMASFRSDPMRQTRDLAFT